MADNARELYTDAIVRLYLPCDDRGKPLLTLREVARRISAEFDTLVPFSTAAYCWRTWKDEQEGKGESHRTNTSKLRPLPWSMVLISCQCGHTRPAGKLPARCPHCGTTLRINMRLTEDAVIWHPPDV